jgi:AMP phosphorylase
MKKLKVKNMNLVTGGILVATLNEKDANHYDLHSLDRIKIKVGKKIETVVLDIAQSNKIVGPGKIGLFEDVIKILDLKNNDEVEIIPAGKPLSLEYIKKKLDGKKLNKKEFDQIVWDIVHHKILEAEITYFVAGCYTHKLTMQETIWLTRSMTDNGEVLKFNKYPIIDKHCIGGVAGNRTTMIIVPIIAAAGLTIPKTSSRSITSPAGTADTVEVIAEVDVNNNDMKKIVRKTNGCMVWGGGLNLSPSDDKIINVERLLSIDAESQLLASVLSKKASVSATHLLIDIPTGIGSKIPDRKKALSLKRRFEKIASKLNIKIQVIITDGRQPIGNGIGPALEAKDVLYILDQDNRRPLDLEKKALMMAGIMFEMVNKAKKGEGYKLAKEILDSGKAYQKFIEIVKAQGKKQIFPDKIKVGTWKHDVKAHKSGKIRTINNKTISKIARIAGAPKNNGAGIYLHKHVGDSVKKGQKIFTIYAVNKLKLEFAKNTLNQLNGIAII